MEYVVWINQLLSSLYIFYQILTCTHTILYVWHLYNCVWQECLAAEKLNEFDESLVICQTKTIHIYS